MLVLTQTKRTDERLLLRMADHYSKPRGFVGRNICYAITYNSDYYGHIVGGSATRFLPGRHEFLGTSENVLNSIVNNIFFNVSKVNGRYPMRNFTSACVSAFEKRIAADWTSKYGDTVVGFETLVEKPRTGRLYILAGWTEVGVTKGYSCKRVGGASTDSWTGSRVWDTINLRPKRVICKKAVYD